jgi:thiol-disulfide isomerase/thioredoxin
MKQGLKIFSVPVLKQTASLVLGGILGLIGLAGEVYAEDKASAQLLFEVQTRPLAPDFLLEDMDGKKQQLSALRGKVVLVNFWATWCPPCRREMPSLERLYQVLKGTDFEILAVNVGEDADTVDAFTSTLDKVPTFTIVFDKDSRVLKAWPVMGLPTTFILDKSGRIIYRAVGGREFDAPSILMQIRSLITPP